MQEPCYLHYSQGLVKRLSLQSMIFTVIIDVQACHAAAKPAAGEAKVNARAERAGPFGNFEGQGRPERSAQGWACSGSRKAQPTLVTPLR